MELREQGLVGPYTFHLPISSRVQSLSPDNADPDTVEHGNFYSSVGQGNQNEDHPLRSKAMAVTPQGGTRGGETHEGEELRLESLGNPFLHEHDFFSRRVSQSSSTQAIVSGNHYSSTNTPGSVASQLVFEHTSPTQYTPPTSDLDEQAQDPSTGNLPAQRPVVSTTAQDQAENLTVHIPDAIRHDLSAMSIYVNDIRHQYAICLTQEELTLRSLQRINARCHNRQSSGQGVPSQLLEQRNGSRSRLQKCAENLNIIRNLANGTPERAEQTIVILPDDLRPYFRSSVDQLFSKHPPENWRGYQGPFERTQRGELKKTSFTADELRVFFDYHIKDGVPLKLWIQKTPQISDVAPQVVRNLDCRFALCACQDQSGSTVPRDIRVAFDEPSKFGDVGRPRNVVGYVHLLCLEQKFHFPTLIRKIGSIDVEVFQNCFGLSFNDSPGLICKPAIAIAKKFIWASIFQTLDACCPDYPRATSTEHFPTGFTGKDELSLTYKMQWAHRGSIDEEHGWKGQQAAMKKQKLTSLSAPINDTTRTDTSSLYDTDSSANSQYSYLQPRADNEQFFELNPTSDAQPSSCKHSNLGSTTSDLTNNQSSEFYADLATQLQGESSTLPPVGPPSHEDDDYDMDEDYPRFPVVTNKPLGKHTAQSSSSATAGRPFSSLLADDLRAAKERVFARNKTEKNTRAPPSQNFLTNEAERWNTTFQETDSNCDPNSDGVNSSEAHGQDPWHLWKQLVSDRGNI